jgi:hypothetical protein
MGISFGCGLSLLKGFLIPSFPFLPIVSMHIANQIFSGICGPFWTEEKKKKKKTVTEKILLEGRPLLGVEKIGECIMDESYEY